MKNYDIRLGVCCGPDRLETVRALGYDYAEYALNYVAALSGEEFRAVRDAVPSDFRVEAVNCLLPGGVYLSDELYDPAACREYLERALGRAAELGVKIAVFGSGAARTVPDGADRARAAAQIEAFGHILAEIAVRNGITAVIEPLNRGECNILNSVREAAELARRVNEPGLQVLTDLYHVELEHEPISDLVDAGPMLRHCHIANPDGRTAPSPSDAYDYRPFFDVLRQIGYRGRVSIEGGWNDFEAEARAALAFLRGLAE